MVDADRSGKAAELSVPLLEEQLNVSKRQVAAGRVRVSMKVETFEETASAELTSEGVEVTRVPIGEPVTGPLPQVRQDGDTTIVPVFEEVLVVEKRLMLKEELHLRKRVSTEVVETPVTLRRQTARIDRIDKPPTGRSKLRPR